jgi:hypothetical protein
LSVARGRRPPRGCARAPSGRRSARAFDRLRHPATLHTSAAPTVGQEAPYQGARPRRVQLRRAAGELDRAHITAVKSAADLSEAELALDELRNDRPRGASSIARRYASGSSDRATYTFLLRAGGRAYALRPRGTSAARVARRLGSSRRDWGWLGTAADHDPLRKH